MRNYALLLGALAALLLTDSAAHAQAYDIVDCGANTNKVKQAVEASLKRLNQVIAAPADVAQKIRVQAFGDYSSDPAKDTWGAAALSLVMLNTRAVLTGGAPVSVSGPAPVYPRLVFECWTGKVRPGEYRSDDGIPKIVLYPEILFDQCPLTEKFGTNRCSQVGTILHEMVHFLRMGGPDIILRGQDEMGSAIDLAAANDWRAYGNAKNYEMYYMTFIF